MATIAARLAKLEGLRRATPSHDTTNEGWLELAAIIAGWAGIGYANLSTGAITITAETSWPLADELDYLVGGLGAYLTAGKLRQEQGYYFATAPEDDAATPFYHWLAGALNRAGDVTQ